MCTAYRSRIGVGNVHHAGSDRVRHDPVAPGLLVCALRKILVAVKDDAFVPCPDPRSVSIAQIELTVFIKSNQRMRIVHHRGTPLCAGCHVVLDTQRMPDFVRG